MNQICFDQASFHTYSFILLFVLLYLIYYIIHMSKERSASSNDTSDLVTRIQSLQEELNKIKRDEENCKNDLQVTRDQLFKSGSTQTRFLEKIYNPLSPPENVYPGGSLTSSGYNSYTQFQQIGYLTGNGEQYPVFARDKYAGKSDKQEYYTINEGRNRIKIPIKTKNFNELYDGDQVSVPQLSDQPFTFQKYEDEGFRYSPNVN